MSCSEHEMLRLVLRLMRRHFRAWRDSVQAERAVKTETVGRQPAMVGQNWSRCLLGGMAGWS